MDPHPSTYTHGDLGNFHHRHPHHEGYGTSCPSFTSGEVPPLIRDRPIHPSLGVCVGSVVLRRWSGIPSGPYRCVCFCGCGVPSAPKKGLSLYICLVLDVIRKGCPKESLLSWSYSEFSIKKKRKSTFKLSCCNSG